MWFLSSLAFANPQSVELNYSVTFDLDATGDKLCGMTKVCDCNALYVGTGTLVEAQGNRLTYAGSWTVAKSDCNDAFALWVPADGKAFHSFTVGTKLSEWVVHGEKSNHAKRKTAIQQNAQFWIDALDHPWPAKQVSVTQQDGSELVMGVKLQANHVLAAAFTD